jgi:DNA-directed RNA polymerase subunit beta
MAGLIQCGRRVRRDFGKIASIVEIPNLIEIQRNSYEAFLQKDYSPEHREDMGLQAVFKSVFPISDYNENASLEFVGYHFGDPKYTVEECHDRGMTHAIPLKVTLRLVVYEQDKSARHRAVKDIKEQEVYLGELPLMTEKGTFIINGTERVVVSQLQRSAGVFFDDDRGKTLASGKKIFSARIIPYRGSWVEFEFDANDILQVRIDRRRKMLATAFLRAFCFLEKGTVLSDEEILGAFYDLEEVLGFEDGAAMVKLNPEIHRHETPVVEDIKAPRQRDPIVQAGRRLNRSRVERMVEAGITKLQVPMAWLENRRTGGRVVDSKTGEVLMEANQLLTSNELAKIATRPVAPFKVVFEDPDKNDASVHETLARDTHRNPDEALVEMYRRLRPGDPPTVESARALFRGMFLDARRYDLARVGRFMLNKKLGTESPLNWKTLRTEDIVAVVRRLLAVKQERYPTDDIDHLGNRRVRSVGELLENQFRVGLTRM